MTETATHAGSCHCGAVAYEVDMAVKDGALDGLIECNCSHCYRKGFVLGFVAPDAFRLLKDGAQTQYRFNNHKIHHRFCEACGVQTFARGTSPDGSEMVAVNVRTLTDLEPWTWTAHRVDGRSF